MLIFMKELAIGSIICSCNVFQGPPNPFMFKETENITFFTHRFARNIFFTAESLYFYTLDCLFD